MSNSSTDLAELGDVTPEALEALQKQQASEIDNTLFQTPILKIGQPLTREVQAEEAEAGEFIDTLRGEGIGDKCGFVAAYYQTGRFAADRDSGRAYTAFGAEIPPHWSDLVGEEFVGQRFDEYPDAEEQYKQRVNRKEIEWGKGPLVSTTHNFTGLVIVSAVEGTDDEDELRPVRLSLQRTNVPAARKILSLLNAGGNRPYWEKVLELGTEKKSFDRGASHLLTVKLGRNTTSEEKAAAVQLALATAAGRTQDNQATANDDAPGNRADEPAAAGSIL